MPDKGYLQYEQSTGRLTVYGDGESPRLVAAGYAGAPCCVNDPDTDHEKSRGPIPRGRYKIRRAGHPRFASPAFALDPIKGTDTRGRSGFWIHGDNARLNRSASTGCIVLDRVERERVRTLIERTGIQLLFVVA